MRFLRGVTLILTIFISSTVLDGTAQAGRGIALPGPFIKSGDTLVKVLELPKREPFLDNQGRQVDLGYLWARDGSKHWVGYVDDTTYYRFTLDQLEIVRTSAGLPELPPVPSRGIDAFDIAGMTVLTWLGLGLMIRVYRKYRA